MRLLAPLLLLTLAAPPLTAETGTTALPFLKLDAGARAAALAGAYCAAGDDALAVFYNPAGTALAERKEILLGHNEWLGGLRNETAAYVHPFESGLSVFGGVNALFSGEMDKYDAAGAARGSFSSREGAASAGASARLGRGYYGGLAVKGLYQSADGTSAMAWAGDAGLLKTHGRWRLGLSASNFGGSMKLGSKAFSLPLMLRGGVSAEVVEHVRLSADAVKPGEGVLQGAFGAEAELPANPKEAFYLRAGYRTGRGANSGPGLSAGLGFRNGDLRLDYSFVPYGDLGDSHRITVAVGFGSVRLAPEEKRAYKIVAPRKPGQKKAPPARRQEKQKKAGSGGSEPVYFMW
ncbi:MAG: hypothetical protein A2X31_07935 [Elusimicrobia bacterium GWB2_63_22]|nr:MAG: hypothetical protein A2X31_07935 [Elusimicrobia bacterium GWB2_63_22]